MAALTHHESREIFKVVLVIVKHFTFYKGTNDEICNIFQVLLLGDVL
jgi:hypothetical protein